MPKFHIPVTIVLDIDFVSTNGKLEARVVIKEPDSTPAEVAAITSEVEKIAGGKLHCPVEGCNFSTDKKRALIMHKTYHNPNRKRGGWGKKPRHARKIEGNFANGGVQASTGKDVDVLDCPNTRCIRKKRFLKGLGYVAEGKEWCCQRCYSDYRESHLVNGVASHGSTLPPTY